MTICRIASLSNTSWFIGLLSLLLSFGGVRKLLSSVIKFGILVIVLIDNPIAIAILSFIHSRVMDSLPLLFFTLSHL